MYFIIYKHGRLWALFAMASSSCRFNKSLLSKVSKFCSRPKHELAGKLLDEVARISGRSKILNKVDVCLYILGNSLFFDHHNCILHAFFWETEVLLNHLIIWSMLLLFFFFFYWKRKLEDHLPICCHITSIWMFYCWIYAFIKMQLLSFSAMYCLFRLLIFEQKLRWKTV